MSTDYIMSLIGLTKSFPPNKTVFENIHLSFFYGAKIGVLGLNGTGKSSLLRVMAGEDTEYRGEVIRKDGTTVAYLPQEPQLDNSLSVKENILKIMGGVADDLARFEEISTEMCDPELSPEKMESLLAEQGVLQEKIDAAGGWDLEHKLNMSMAALRVPPADSRVDTLSGGEKRRVALCGIILKGSDILLLDEPTNHLDAESVHWLERFLHEYEGTVVAVTHDRYFLDNVAGWILELDRGKGYPFEGNYSSWLEQKEKRLAQEEKSDQSRKKTLERELEWIRMAPKARRSKSKARLNNYEALLKQDGGDKIRELEIFIPPGPRLGDKVIELKSVTKSFGERTLLKDLSLSVPKAAIVGIVGPNGAGKTTLFRLITGQEKPDSGEVEIGESVKLGYVDQHRDDLQPDKSVWETISEGREEITLGSKEMNSRAYCARFNFYGADQQKKVGVLSGGERNRVHLAKLLKNGSNVLLLDEPSNDLDVNTLRALEDGISDYAGCVMVISHDRWFLDRICTHILAFEGDGQIEFFAGDFSEYEEFKAKGSK